MLIELLPLVLTKSKACSTLRAVADGFQDLHSIRLTESLCPISPSGRAEAVLPVPTDQAEIVQDDQLELQEHCTADHTAATRVDDGQGLCSPARCRRWTVGLTLDSLKQTTLPFIPIRSSRDCVDGPGRESSKLTSSILQEHCDTDQTRHPCERWVGLVQPYALSQLNFRTYL
jgi:hypothetical protein